MHPETRWKSLFVCGKSGYLQWLLHFRFQWRKLLVSGGEQKALGKNYIRFPASPMKTGLMYLHSSGEKYSKFLILIFFSISKETGMHWIFMQCHCTSACCCFPLFLLYLFISSTNKKYLLVVQIQFGSLVKHANASNKNRADRLWVDFRRRRMKR